MLTTIQVCANCGKKSCDGNKWIWIKVTDLKTRKDTPLSEIPVENQSGCTLHHGLKQRKYLKDQPVGAEVDLTYTNWTEPSILRVRRVE